MRELEAKLLGDKTRDLCIEVSRGLSADALRALEGAIGEEKSERGREVLQVLLKNARISQDENIPLCQDTGTFSVFVHRGTDVLIEGDVGFEINRGVSEATRIASLRPSVTDDPLGSRRNTGDNTPAFIYYQTVPGDGLRLGVMARGGGCENASASIMLPPSAGWDGIKEFVVDLIRKKGPGACPPLFLGIAVGGSFDRAPAAAKEALFREVGARSSVERIADREKELSATINMTGVGPGGFGGSITCLGVSLRYLPCHIASLPLAVAVSCHALRRKVSDL